MSAVSSEEASEDEPSRSEQLSGASDGMSLEERVKGDKANHNSDQSRHCVEKALLEKVAEAPEHHVNVAIVLMSNFGTACSEELVTTLAAVQANKVKPLAKVTKALTGSSRLVRSASRRQPQRHS